MSSDPDKIFKPETMSVKKIFRNPESFYKIPDYQRPYSWGDEQIETLFDDIYGAMKEKVDGYFLGSAVLVQHNGYFDVVDGQQRLTTLTILFCVVRDTYGEKLEQENKTLYNSIQDSIKSKIEEGKPRLNLITQINMQNLFEHEILEKVKFPSKSFSEKEKGKLENKFANAAFLIRRKFAEIETGGFGEIIKFLEYLMGQVEIITITCPDISYAVKLFQVINTRGLDLSPSDLIKSELLGKFDSKDEIERDTFISTWNKIEELSKGMEESMTDLLTYYEYYLLGENPKRDLYSELLKKFKNEKPNDTAYKFSKFVESFYQIYKIETPLLFSFRYLQNQVFWKAILATAKYKNVDYFDEICRELRRMYYVYWVAGYTTSKIKQISFNILKWIGEGMIFDRVKRNIRNKMVEDGVYTDMRLYLEDEVYGETWVKPLLILVEYAQTDSSKPVFIELDKNLHLDHILPEEWAKVKEWKDAWKEEEAKSRLNTIGNLTLLSGRKNIAAQNFSFAQKKKIYEKGYGGKTAFEISKKIIDKAEWTQKDVDIRKMWLFDQINGLLGVNVGTDLKPSEGLDKELEDFAKSQQVYTVESYQYLKEDGSMRPLFEELRKEILEMDTSVREEYQKRYVAYKSVTNFVDIIPQKNALRLSLNIPFDQIKDPEGKCIDETGKGRWGNGDTYFKLTSQSEIKYALELIKQVFDYVEDQNY